MVVIDPSLLRDISQPIAPIDSMSWLRTALWLVAGVLGSAALFASAAKWGLPLFRALHEWCDPGAEVRLTRQIRKFQRHPDRLSSISLDLWWETLLHVIQKRGILPAESLTFEEVLTALGEVGAEPTRNALREEIAALMAILECTRYSGQAVSPEDTLAGAGACIRVLSLIKSN